MSLSEIVKSGKFAALAEFQPPKGAGFEIMGKRAEQIRGRAAAVIVPELAMAVMKASSLGACAYLQNLGVETIYQVCPRDRNRLALQADILSAGALGVPNLMAVEGDDIAFGDQHQAREVKDLDLMNVLEAAEQLAGGKDLAGNPVIPAPQFYVGAELQVGGDDSRLESELKGLRAKIDLGVKFVVTAPIFDLKRLKQIVDEIDTQRVAVFPTVLVLKSGGMAKYVNQNVTHMHIPNEVIKRFDMSKDPPRTGLEIAGELLAEIKSMGLAGAVISTRGWESKLPQLLDIAGL